MNIHIPKALLAAIWMSGSTFAQGGAIPVESYLVSAHGNGETAKVVGVLGRTPECGLAIYSDPDAATLRHVDQAVVLATTDDEALPLPSDVTELRSVIGHYVMVVGESMGSSSPFELRNSRVYYAFAKRVATAPVDCAASDARWVRLRDLLGARVTQANGKVRVSGVLAPFGSSGLALYTDRASARERIFTNAMVIADASYLDTYDQQGGEASISDGKLAIVSGTVAPGRARGSTRVVMTHVSDADFLD